MAMLIKETKVITTESIPFPVSKRNSKSLDLSINTTDSLRHHTRSTSDGGSIQISIMPVAQNTQDTLEAALPSPIVTHSDTNSPTNSSSLLFNFGLGANRKSATPSRKPSFCSSIIQKVRVGTDKLLEKY